MRHDTTMKWLQEKSLYEQYMSELNSFIREFGYKDRYGALFIRADRIKTYSGIMNKIETLKK